MKNRQSLLMTLVLLLLCGACSQEVFDENQPGGDALVFEASVGDGAASRQTKGTPLGKDQLQNIGVFGYMTGEGPSNSWKNKRNTARPDFLNNIKVARQNDKWAADRTVYWPKKVKANVSFFAYSPFINGSNQYGLSIDGSRGGLPTFTYTVPNTCQNQPDLLIASVKQDLTVGKDGGKEVAFEMRHALTSIGFKGRAFQGQISRILIEKVATSGQLLVADDGTPNWTSLRGDGRFEAVVSSDANRVELNSSDGYLMMIPQTLAAGAKLQVELKNGATASWNLTGQQWVAGQCVYYDLDVAEQYSLKNLPFAGAFWRNDQTGERIIRMPLSCSKGTFLKGTWKAWVENVGSFPAGDIVLSADKTADRGVTFQAGESPADMNNRTNDQNYRVAGTATTVSGVITEQDGIYFRIGLRSTCSQNQIRYARIAVEYGVGEQKVKAFIYLRQGQEADYVMPYQKRVTDAKRMTVYNLKAPTAYYYGYKNLAVNGAGFTDYPSQAGAYFQWANDRLSRYAYSNLYTSGWSLDTSDKTWYELSSNHSVCPRGYRRPYDGYIDRDVLLNYPFSEPEFEDVDDRLRDIRQIAELKSSLIQDWNNPAGNSLYGYYADGFFDRRQVTADAVAAQTENMACGGVLYVNTQTLASLFFPASGYREGQNGELMEVGKTARYWTGGALISRGYGQNIMRRALCLDIRSNHYHIPYRSAGTNIRCVKDERSYDTSNYSRDHGGDDDDD